MKNVEIAYGKSRLNLSVPESFDIIEPIFEPKLDNLDEKILDAMKNPISSKPLRSLLNESSKIAISVCDITRAQPRKIILEAIVDHIKDIVPPSNIKVLIATGTHRPNTKEELIDMLGERILSTTNVINHNSSDKNNLSRVSTSLNDVEVYLNSDWVNSDIKITTGFVEPHFFAGFSGGPKLVAPGLAGLETIMSLHNYRRLKSEFSSWAEIDKNPIQQDVRTIAKESGVDFTLDVTLNKNQDITGVFAGDLVDSHNQACDYARKTAMVEVEEPYDLVLTSNSGYPLDQNLYQAVKGMSAAAQITKKGGQILCFAECSDGIPNHGNFYSLLSSFTNPSEVKNKISKPDFHSQDQWQVQILSEIALNNSIHMFADGLTEKEMIDSFLKPEPNPQEFLNKIAGSDIKGCVLPEGPITIPYVG
jgi:nickel-dependent lactate racemase